MMVFCPLPFILPFGSDLAAESLPLPLPFESPFPLWELLPLWAAAARRAVALALEPFTVPLA